VQKSKWKGQNDRSKIKMKSWRIID